MGDRTAGGVNGTTTLRSRPPVVRRTPSTHHGRLRDREHAAPPVDSGAASHRKRRLGSGVPGVYRRSNSASRRAPGSLHAGIAQQIAAAPLPPSSSRPGGYDGDQVPHRPRSGRRCPRDHLAGGHRAAARARRRHPGSGRRRGLAPGPAWQGRVPGFPGRGPPRRRGAECGGRRTPRGRRGGAGLRRRSHPLPTGRTRKGCRSFTRGRRRCPSTPDPTAARAPRPHCTPVGAPLPEPYSPSVVLRNAFHPLPDVSRNKLPPNEYTHVRLANVVLRRTMTYF